MQFLLMLTLFLLAVFLIILVLVQRGKGGGLAGALGGMGGQSAFGTKAGDFFTRLTIVVASAWILLCLVSVALLTRWSKQVDLGDVPAVASEADDAGSGPMPAEAPASESGESK